MTTAKWVLVTGDASVVGSYARTLCVDNLFSRSGRNVERLTEKSLFVWERRSMAFPLFVDVDAIYNRARCASPFHDKAQREAAR